MDGRVFLSGGFWDMSQIFISFSDTVIDGPLQRAHFGG
jgi:hypothetical protein